MSESELRLGAARRRAILMILGAAGAFAAAAAMVKALDGAVPLAQVVLGRNLFAIPALVPVLLAAGGWRALRTKYPMGHVWRCMFGLGGMFGAFYGYQHLPLALVSALGFTMPLFLTLLSVPLLGERVGPRRLGAVLVGFGGVLLMVRPWQGEMLGGMPAMAAVVGAALAWALAMISIRKLGERGESGPSIVLWFAIGSAMVSGALALPGWVWPTGTQWLLLVGTGLISALAQVLMTEAYRRGEPSLIAPFEYSGIVWTTALGGLLWGELPDGWDFAGIAVLVGAGLYIWHREVRLGLRR
ncbi:DMT family transporter [Plastoroseomonas arctica]|uniref:DMT family transporter n=1 Tax=Plastoroseomonas arctica TaxID=1509237 RepID=A0AAF1KM83_9PROT|nr:DMT family transporter [Plastoroseomonas arctica]MBR0655976.1 DMT family transporter [Plastoroseomonas arctica]